MSEATIQTALQTALLALAEYDTGDVFIDDWSRLDGPTVNAPYAQIQTADRFDQRQDSMDGVTVTWQIPVAIYVRWQDWDTARQSMRDTRQATIEAFRGDGAALDAGSSYLIIDRIQAETDIVPYFSPGGLPASNSQLPTYLVQELTLTVVEEIC